MATPIASTIRQLFQVKDRLVEARRVCQEWRNVVASTVGTDLHSPAVARFNAALAHEAALRARRDELAKRLTQSPSAGRLLAAL